MRFSFLCSLLILCFARVADADDQLKIGAVFSLSSWGAEGGTAELNGLRLAQEDINKAGGIGGKKVEIVVEDNRSDLKATASAIRKVIDIDGVVAIVGPNWAEFTEVAAPISEGAKVTLISPTGYKEGLFEGKRFAFTLWQPHHVATTPLSEVFRTRGYRNVEVLLSENAYLEGILNGVQANLRGTNVSVSEAHRFAAGQKDYRSIITRLKAKRPDAVLVLLLENSDLSPFLVQAKQLKLGLPLYTANGVAFDAELLANPAIAEGMTYFDYLTPGGEQFLNRYRERYGREAGFGSARAYDALFLLKDAITRCGARRDLIRNCVSDASYGGLSGLISFDNSGVIKTKEPNTYLAEIRDGKVARVPNHPS
ncbi:MAG: ABC transporter substrate-binding protein [Cyclobacteriaceae bacterium]|jgi:branched-chain amino acid transport system substrate-binding protein